MTPEDVTLSIYDLVHRPNLRGTNVRSIEHGRGLSNSVFNHFLFSAHVLAVIFQAEGSPGDFRQKKLSDQPL